ncbi:dual-action HEIGH metallo-peptidase [Chitinophaga niastensis]|uniref:Dual-action HEIGH metallo-peptidase n=1 Tax=Chitinophaga niastensis TaxID=536980 RepID=A0A2P8HCA0_CHINA|nr:M57 family metalloprotease [Chitinophaga niastensis]PSL43858.1 dual-action HEIGH metallo-peptidase [Chitinophaga niastensis]
MEKKFGLFSFAGIILLFSSCVKTEPDKETPPVPPVKKEPIELIKDMGFSTANVVQKSGGYLVEGDIFIPTTELDKKHETKILRVGPVEQYHTAELVANCPRTLKIYVSALGAAYESYVDDAINRFNGARTSLRFARTSNAAEANITVYGYAEATATNGYAGLPSGGEPYPAIYLNTTRFSAVNNAGWAVSIVFHEMGHCVGFRHTDLVKGGVTGCLAVNEGTVKADTIQLQSTIITEKAPTSFMLPCMPERTSRSVSSSDVFALSYLYSPGGVPGPQAFFQFYNSGTQDHYMWINANMQYIYPLYGYVEHTHRVYASQVPGTVALYQFYKDNDPDHIYSTNIHILDGNTEWHNEGISCYVYTTPVAGTVPVYGYYNASVSDHIYTTNASISFNGYVSMGIAYYGIMPQL